MQAPLNTHTVGAVDLGLGVVSIAGVATSVDAVFAHLEDGAFILQLGAEHAARTPGPATATLEGSLIGVVRSLVGVGFAVLASYLRKPKTVPSAP